MMKKRVALIACLALVVAGVYFFHASEFLKIDRCLDAGGRWNDALKECDLKR